MDIRLCSASIEPAKTDSAGPSCESEESVSLITCVGSPHHDITVYSTSSRSDSTSTESVETHDPEPEATDLLKPRNEAYK